MKNRTGAQPPIHSTNLGKSGIMSKFSESHVHNPVPNIENGDKRTLSNWKIVWEEMQGAAASAAWHQFCEYLRLRIS